MSILRLIIGVLIGLLSISVIVEVIELIIVVNISDLDFSEATNPEYQQEYFIARNAPLILAAKMIYSIIGGFVGGFLASIIAGDKAKTAVIAVTLLQIVSLIWAGFFSDFSITGPTWMWIALMIIIPIGIWIGYLQRLKMITNRGTTNDE